MTHAADELYKYLVHPVFKLSFEIQIERRLLLLLIYLVAQELSNRIVKIFFRTMFKTID